jgi:hypothetical protein
MTGTIAAVTLLQLRARIEHAGRAHGHTVLRVGVVGVVVAGNHARHLLVGGQILPRRLRANPNGPLIAVLDKGCRHLGAS